jgi:hypothetical protein
MFWIFPKPTFFSLSTLLKGPIFAFGQKLCTFFDRPQVWGIFGDEIEHSET